MSGIERLKQYLCKASFGSNSDRHSALECVAEIERALAAYAGPLDDPGIGWVGHTASRHNMFQCERCGAEHLDCTQIVHKDGCSAKAILNMLTPN